MNNEDTESRMDSWKQAYVNVGLEEPVAQLLAEYQWDGRREWKPQVYDAQKTYVQKKFGSKYGPVEESMYLANKGLAVLFTGNVDDAVELLTHAREITPLEGDNRYSAASLTLLIDNAPAIMKAMHQVYGKATE